MSIRINRITKVGFDAIQWSLFESTPPDAQNWRQLSFINDIITLDPGNYVITLTLDNTFELSHIDFLIGTDNPMQKYYRFNASFVSEPMYFTAPTNLKLYIYYKIIKIPHISSDNELINIKIPHIASELISGKLYINI